MKLASVTIGRRFCGPPGSGNGGYVCGVLAGFAPDVREVRLAIPPPLEVPLDVIARDDDVLELRDGETLVATARSATVDFDVPPAPALAAAKEAAAHYAGLREHAFPGCFVCGPARPYGDGLCVYAGPGPTLPDGRRLYATPWVPDPTLAGTRGHVRPEFQWAVLDCPGYFAVATGAQKMLLGSLAARIDRAVSVGEQCIVSAWSLGSEGRKHRAATALYGADGECVARALAVWIELRG